MAGVDVSSKYGPRKKKPNAVEDMYNLYGTSVQKQAGDYDDIMSRFKDIYNRANADPSGGYTPYQADLANYSKSADTTAALANLKDLTETGGLSAGDQQNLRARGVSPIRSMYATASRDMDRNRRLSGGYSPNFGAVTAKMTRDMSSQIADQMDKVNANIAEMVQSGKLSAAPNYASAAQAESELASKFELSNRDAKNQAKRDNAMGMFDAKKNQTNLAAEAARGMTSLYGTTPALPNLYGSQAADARNFESDQKQKKRNAGIALMGQMGRF
jgi:hypothetical protein